MSETRNPYLDLTRDEIMGAIYKDEGLPPIDTALLEKGRAWVNEQAQLDESECEWNQWVWINDNAQNECGTSYCFAGYIGAITAGVALNRDNQEVTLNNGERVHVATFAQFIMGLTYAEQNYLFAGTNDADDINQVVDGLIAKAGRNGR
jgi:hypothetical protein